MFERALNLETGLPCALSTRLRFGLARIWLFVLIWLVTADLYPNEVSGIENGTTHNDIKVRTFSIWPYIFNKTIILSLQASSILSPAFKCKYNLAMEREFLPPKTKALVINSILAVLLIVVILFFLIYASYIGEGWLAIVFIALGLVLLAPLFLTIYRGFTIITTNYHLTRDALEIKWGLRRELIPLREIEWVHPVSDFQTPLPIPYGKLRASFYDEIEINGLGKTLFVATKLEQMVLIKLDQAYVVLSPNDKDLFTQAFNELSQMGSLESPEAESENLKMLWRRVIEDKKAKNLLILTAISLFVLIAMAVVIVAIDAPVVWVDMIPVPPTRLFLLALLGLLFNMLNTAFALFLYLQERSGKAIVYLILAWSVLTNLMLAFAMLSMVI